MRALTAFNGVASSSDVTLSEFSQVPVIEVAPLMHHTVRRAETAAQIDAACREAGFFYVVGHGVDESLCQQLDALSREFFAWSERGKMGSRCRGVAARGAVIPSGSRADVRQTRSKRGSVLWNGTAGRSSCRAGPYSAARTEPVSRHSRFPRDRTALPRCAHRSWSRRDVGYLARPGLDERYFRQRYYRHPLILFRIFNYPGATAPAGGDTVLGVGEHIDYGLLTILRQDDTGLQVKSRARWIHAPPNPGSFLCNIGDMLELLTHGIYRSTPHRVLLNTSSRDRLSFPFFFDPSFYARTLPVEGVANDALTDDSAPRWDHANLHDFSGRYGDYLLKKVSKVF